MAVSSFAIIAELLLNLAGSSPCYL